MKQISDGTLQWLKKIKQSS